MVVDGSDIGVANDILEGNTVLNTDIFIVITELKIDRAKAT